MVAGRSVKELLQLTIRWRKVAPGRWQAEVDGEPCLLVMNDFPEEPLYTVAYAGHSLDVEDAPHDWDIE